MNNYTLKIILLVASYILGGVPFGLIIGKAWKGVDIRNYGSGNIGATNVLRALGPGPAAVVFALDVLKGLVPVIVVKHLYPESALLAVASGMLAILGHTLSIFLRFRGGKGVATSLGVIIGLDPRVAGIGFGIWLIFVALTRYVSLASILAAISIPVFMFVFRLPIEYKAFSLLASSFVLVKHRSNITRLFQHKEPKLGEKVKISEARDGKRN